MQEAASTVSAFRSILAQRERTEGTGRETGRSGGCPLRPTVDESSTRARASANRAVMELNGRLRGSFGTVFLAARCAARAPAHGYETIGTPAVATTSPWRLRRSIVVCQWEARSDRLAMRKA